jgi:hypothetical protein
MLIAFFSNFATVLHHFLSHIPPPCTKVFYNSLVFVELSIPFRVVAVHSVVFHNHFHEIIAEFLLKIIASMCCQSSNPDHSSHKPLSRMTNNLSK